MKEKEKALTEAATSERAVGETTAGAGISTKNYYNESAGYIASFLMHGEENALTTKALLQRTGIETTRQLQKEIEVERSLGMPILTKPGMSGGYFLPSNDPAAAAWELRRYCRYMRAKAIGCFRSSKAAKKMLRSLERDLSGQERIEEDCCG